MPLRATATAAEPDLLFLPWGVALEQWPAQDTVALPRGISRHVVRFVRVNGAVYAVKEITEYLAVREYGLLRQLVDLRDTLKRHGYRVTMVAPSGEQSATSMSTTMNRALALVQTEDDSWHLDAAPADTVLVALRHLLESEPPDLVVSGGDVRQASQ